MKHVWKAALPLALLLAACGPQTTVSTDTGKIARDLDGSLTLQADGQPPARISATGDLTIDGKAVALTPAQRQLAVAYYGELHGITLAGIEVGKQGAKLAGKAVGEAISGVLNGNTEDMDAKIEAEAKKIEVEAKKICNHLGGLRTAQDALAAQVPQFRPYANIDQKDIDDCGKDDDTASS